MKLKDIEKHFVVDIDMNNPIDTWVIGLASTDISSYKGGPLPKGFVSHLPIIFNKEIALDTAQQLTELTGKDFGVFKFTVGTKKEKPKSKKKPVKKAKKK